jgi:hypothetical protein
VSRPLTLVGYAALVVAIVAYQLVGLLGRRTPTLGEALEPLRRSLAGRIVLAGAWLWLGWHLFVRGTWR